MRLLALPLVLAFSLLTSISFAQEEFGSNQINLGLGIGLDYGGIGTRITVLPDPSFGVFAAVGYVLNGIGYNMGSSYYFRPTKRLCPYATAMYGYNAITFVEGTSKYNDRFSGLTFGGGLELRSRKRPGNFWNFELLVPLRSSAYYSQIAAIKNDPQISGSSETATGSISIGYHISF